MMEFDTDRFRVTEGETLDLRARPTRVDPLYKNRKGYTSHLEAAGKEIGKLQRVLYGADRHAVLLIFQGMDTAGKDGAIRRVMSGVDPTGCQVFAFKQPSSEELDHDWMWRTTCRMPERGRIGIFNRSYYEEVLIVRVRPEILRSQRIPRRLVDETTIWQERYSDIVRFEDYMTRNGTKIVKFFLHVSREEQRQRFLARIDDPDKHWKFAPSDIDERQRWDDYQRAYRDALAWTSTESAPWYVVPADDKMNARMIISRVIRDQLHSLGLRYPEPTSDHRALLDRAQAILEAEGPGGAGTTGAGG